MDTNELIYLFYFGIALISTLILIPSIIKLALKFRLFEQNNFRKTHRERVSSLGGIGIYSGFWIAVMCLSSPEDWASLKTLFLTSFIFILVNLMDDLVKIRTIKKLFIQFLLGLMLCWAGILIYLPANLWFASDLSSVLLTLLVFLVITNAYNFIDGINGLAGGLSLIAALAISFLFYSSGQIYLSQISLAFAGALLGFMKFNFGKAKIFMGDNGSTFIGLLLTFLSIRYWNHLQLESLDLVFPSFIILLSLMAVPIFDIIRVVLTRIFKKQHPLFPDRSHIHHLLLDAGLSQKFICLLLYVISIAGIVLSISLASKSFLLSSFGLAILALSPNWLVGLLKGRTDSDLAIQQGEEKPKPPVSKQFGPLS